VTVAFLPSITREFMPNDDGFSPSPVYLAAIESLKNGIMQAYRNAAVQSEDEDESGPARDGLLSETVSFQAVENRPMVIYPENAASVIQETCPAADFIVIILGRNVYQSMHIDPAADTYPAVNRLYLDITDIKHGQAASEIKEIGEFLYKKLKPRLAAVLPERTAS